MAKKTSPKSKELFEKIISSEFEKLRKEPDTLFENLSITLNYNDQYEKFKKSDKYLKLLHETEYNKIKILKEYFLTDIMFPVIEEVMVKVEDTDFTNEILLENSYDVLLKKLNPKNEILLNKINELNETEQLRFIVENAEVLKQYGLLEEGPIKNFADRVITRDNNVFFRISRIIIKNLNLLMGLGGKFFGVFFGGLRDILTVIPIVNSFMGSVAQLDNDKKVLLKVTVADSQYLNDFMRSYGKITIGDIGKRCWDKSMAMATNYIDPELNANILQNFYTISSVNYAFQNPHEYDHNDPNNEPIYSQFFSNIDNDKEFNKRVHYYRKCFYGNMIDYITGFLRVSLEMEGVEKNLLRNIKYLKDDGAQFLKTFREFYDFKPKNDAERIFVNATIALLDIKGIALETLSNINRYRLLDIYLQEDMEFVLNKVKQAFNDIDQMSNDVLRDTRPQTGYKKYEENYRQNKDERKMIGNDNKKPKKLSLFD